MSISHSNHGSLASAQTAAQTNLQTHQQAPANDGGAAQNATLPQPAAWLEGAQQSAANRQLPPGTISLALGKPDPATFPVHELKAAFGGITAEQYVQDLQYGNPKGLLELRDTIAQMLPWKVDPDQIIVTSGSQQGLSMLGAAMLDKGDLVLTESPTYFGALEAFAPRQPKVEGLASDEQGIRPGALARHLDSGGQKPKFVYLTPNFQNPGGTVMSDERRDTIAQMAKKHGVLLVEDNPYGELYFDGKKPPPSIAERAPENTIYMGSFSKTLAPGLRVGFMVVPKSHLAALAATKSGVDLCGTGPSQRATNALVTNGTYEKNLPNLRQLYSVKRDAMVQAIDHEMSDLGVEYRRPEGGMFVFLRLPEGLDAAKLAAQAEAKGVSYVPGEKFYPQDPDRRTLRLAFSMESPDNIRKAIGQLAGVIRDEVTAQRAAAEPLLQAA